MCDAYHGVCVHLLVHMSMVRSEEEWCMWCWVTIVVLVLWSTLSIGRLLTSSVCYFIIGPPIFDKKYLRIYSPTRSRRRAPEEEEEERLPTHYRL